MKCYQVGGAIRDKLLGLPVTDRDWVVVGATPEQMEAAGYRPVGRDFPVFLHPDTHEEYALARTERKSGRGYRGFTINASPDVTLEEDLKRRDITINALVEDDNGQLIDLVNGRKDLEAGILRHVSDAFVEDPLRVLRVARFAARFDFTVADETLELMTQISMSGELESLSPERVWTEMEKALSGGFPVRFFEVLRACSALGQLIPELERLFGIPQPELHHPEIDTGVHTMMVLEQASHLSDDPVVRFAALMHDLGKGTTPKGILPSHNGHEERGVKLVQAVCDRFRIPNRYRDLAVIVARHHLVCHKIDELRAETVLKKLEEIDAFRRPDRFDQFLVACEADARGRTGFENIEYHQASRFRRFFHSSRDVDTTPLISSGLSGKELAREIARHRVQTIRSVR